MHTGSLEELPGSQEVPAVAGLCPRHSEGVETFVSAEIFGCCDSADSMERVQGEEPLLSDLQECDTASDAGQGIPGSTQVSGKRLMLSGCMYEGELRNMMSQYGVEWF